MDEDEVLNKITSLLEKGCTMLATHHDCGAPLFRCKGEVVCPVCSFVESDSNSKAKTQVHGFEQSEKASLDEEKPYLKQGSQSSKREMGSKGTLSDGTEFSSIRIRLHRSMLNRLEQLTQCLEEEQDLDKLKKLLDCVEGLLRVQRFLRE